MKTVFFDIDTQIDFVYPAGALYVPGAETVLGQVAALNRHAAASPDCVLISTADAHTEDDPEFEIWPAHCVAGTVGQQKPAVTLIEKRLVIPASKTDAVAAAGAPQILLEKLHNDCFTNPNLDPLLDALGAARYVVYGVVTEICVRCAAFGLLDRGRNVELVTGAVRSLDTAKADEMFREFQARGGVLTTTAQVLAA